jgi:hypothetical protein
MSHSTCPRVGESVWIVVAEGQGRPWKTEKRTVRQEIKEAGGQHSFLLVDSPDSAPYPCGSCFASKSLAMDAIMRWTSRQ